MKPQKKPLPDREILTRQGLLGKGFSDHEIKQLVEEGKLVRGRRGVYVQPEATPSRQHDLAQVACTVQNGVFVLITALAFHMIGTEVARQVWLQIPMKARPPKIDWPPLRLVRSSLPEAFSIGVETHLIDGIEMMITSPARTVVDCFKHRNKIGLDVFLEALRETTRSKKATIGEIGEMARKLKISRGIDPYLETVA